MKYLSTYLENIQSDKVLVNCKTPEEVTSLINYWRSQLNKYWDEPNEDEAHHKEILEHCINNYSYNEYYIGYNKTLIAFNYSSNTFFTVFESLEEYADYNKEFKIYHTGNKMGLL